jgi:hypothetical protein
MLSSPAKREHELVGVHRDKRGAVLVIGLCMACFLIGCLWSLIGIGDAIVFRDGMQEATDHATFTSAVLHAKGMNFISACNLFILALIGVHVIMGLIHDILLAICIISLGSSCSAFTSYRQLYINYGKLFKPIAGAIHQAEVVASFGYPLLATFKGFTTGKDYGDFGPKKHTVNMIVVSPSLLPGGIMDAQLDRAFENDQSRETAKNSHSTGEKGKKKGLPVEAKKFSSVCDLVGKKGIDGLLALTGYGDNDALSMVKDWIGSILKVRYCNESSGMSKAAADRLKEAQRLMDRHNSRSFLFGGQSTSARIPNMDENSSKNSGSGGNGDACMQDNSTIDPGFDKWWGCEGPLVPWGGMENGSPWNQVWGVNLQAEYSDAQEHRVALGGRKLGATSSVETTTYFAAAEFYFDCTRKWDDVGCDKDDNAGYSVQWRARLRRLQFAEVGRLLSSFATSFLTNLQAYRDFQSAVKGLPTQFFGSDNPLITGKFEKEINKVFDKYVTRPLDNAGNKAGQKIDSKLGVYH